MTDGFSLELSTGVIVCATAVGLCASAFFSGSETGLMSTSRVRLQHLARKGRKRNVRSLLFLLDSIEESILTCLIGTNFFNVLVSALLTAAMTVRYPRYGEEFALLLTAVLTINMGEILPKILYREFPESLTLGSAPVLRGARFVLLPLLWLLGGYSRLLTKLISRSDPAESHAPGRRRSLAADLQEHAGDHDRRFAETLRRFLELSGRDLSKLITPAEEMVTVGTGATVADCLSVADESGRSRLPVMVEEDQSLAGWLLVRDLLLQLSDPGDLDRPLPGSLVRTCLLVDVRMTPYELFEEFHDKRQQLAMVVDSSGGVLGLITLEDLIETVVGSIEDEFD